MAIAKLPQNAIGLSGLRAERSFKDYVYVILAVYALLSVHTMVMFVTTQVYSHASTPAC